MECVGSASIKEQPQSFPDDALSRGHGRIPIMADNEIVRESSCSILEELGYEVALGCDGTEAHDVHRKSKEAGKPFGAIIMDLTLPGGLGG